MKAVVSCASKNKTSSERKAKRSAHGERSEILELGAKRCSDKSSDGRPKRLLAKFPYHCHMH